VLTDNVLFQKLMVEQTVAQLIHVLEWYVMVVLVSMVNVYQMIHVLALLAHQILPARMEPVHQLILVPEFSALKAASVKTEFVYVMEITMMIRFAVKVRL
jgi:hypothetical protein